MSETRICPMCRGRAFVEITAPRRGEDQRRTHAALAKRWRRLGLSLRQIARALGYKNHNSVIRLLEGRRDG